MNLQIKPVRGHELGDVRLAWDICEKLNEHYPGWGWDVGVFDEANQGVLKVINKTFEMFSPLNNCWGLVIPLKVAYSDPDRKQILRRAGQMLEFCGLPARYTGGDLNLTEFARNYETYSKRMAYGFGPKD